MNNRFYRHSGADPTFPLTTLSTQISGRGILLLALALTVLATPCKAQPSTATYPSQAYYLGLEALHEGALRDAMDAFETTVRSGRTSIAGKWIDSIPGYAMMGECYYQQGNLLLAHQNFDAAIRLMLQHNGWLSTVQWQKILPSGGVPNPSRNWANSSRTFRLANVPSSMSVQIGSLDVEGQLRRGGTFQTAQLVRVDVAEIMRTVAWSVYRRGQILGPLAVDDPLTQQFHSTMARIQSPPEVGARQWLDVILALSKISSKQPDQAIGLAERSIQLPGNLDHNLTPLALLTVANLLGASGQAKAMDFYIEAALSATMQEQYEVAAEALRAGMGPAAMAGSGALLGPARSAALKLQRQSRLLAATALLVATESAVMAGQTDEAQQSLQQASGILSRRNVILPRLSAYANYCMALLAFQKGDSGAAAKSLDDVLRYAFTEKPPTTPHQYQLQIVQAALRAGKIGPRTGDDLLSELTSGPAMRHWLSDPIDALSATRTSQSISELRLASMMTRTKSDKALTLADRLLADRFRGILPLSGRRLDLRWLAAADPSQLSKQAQAVRDKPPNPVRRIMASVDEMQGLQKLIAAMPIVGVDAAGASALQTAWAKLDGPAKQAELFVSEAAVRRMIVPRSFPPELGESSDWPKLARGNAILTFCPAGADMFAFMWTEGKVHSWRVQAPGTIKASLSKWMQDLGVVRRRGGVAQLTDQSAWYPSAAAIRNQLLAGVEQATWNSLKRLVVVPYGQLWYVPFELLPYEDEDGPRCGEKIEISYAPTPGLALNPPTQTTSGSETGIVGGRFFTPTDLALNSDFQLQVIESTDNVVELPEAKPTPGSMLSTRLSRVAVATLIDPGNKSPMTVSPFVYDQSMPGGPLGAWLQFPWGGPRELLLPGFRSSIAKPGASPEGDELFLTACGLQAAGVRHILLSRWPVGGASTASLLSEYLTESSFSTPMKALKRARLVLKSQELDPEYEPLLNDGDADGATVTGANPLFWSGYMMIGAEIERQ